MSKSLADLQEKRTALLWWIQNWHEVQLIYIPQVASLLSQLETPPETSTNTAPPSENLVETIPLFMPSSLPQHIRTLPMLHDICLLERQLHEPQASDTLADICHQHRVIQGLWQFKKLNVSGTGNKWIPSLSCYTSTLTTKQNSLLKGTRQHGRLCTSLIPMAPGQHVWSNWRTLISVVLGRTLTILAQATAIMSHCGFGLCHVSPLNPTTPREECVRRSSMTICMLRRRKLRLAWCDGRWSCCSCRRKCSESSNITNGKLPGGVCRVLYEHTMTLQFSVVFQGMPISWLWSLCA